MQVIKKDGLDIFERDGYPKRLVASPNNYIFFEENINNIMQFYRLIKYGKIINTDSDNTLLWRPSSQMCYYRFIKAITSFGYFSGIKTNHRLFYSPDYDPNAIFGEANYINFNNLTKSSYNTQKIINECCNKFGFIIKTNECKTKEENFKILRDPIISLYSTNQSIKSNQIKGIITPYGFLHCDKLAQKIFNYIYDKHIIAPNGTIIYQPSNKSLEDSFKTYLCAKKQFLKSIIGKNINCCCSDTNHEPS